MFYINFFRNYMSKFEKNLVDNLIVMKNKSHCQIILRFNIEKYLPKQKVLIDYWTER